MIFCSKAQNRIFSSVRSALTMNSLSYTEAIVRKIVHFIHYQSIKQASTTPSQTIDLQENHDVLGFRGPATIR